MTIYIGSNKVKEVFIGDRKVKEIYVGDQKVYSSFPSGYVWATDDDFSGTTNGNFKYIGTGEYVAIPNVIKGVNVTSYSEMFRDYAGTQLKGVASFNENLESTYRMFYGARASVLDLSSFDTSNVTDMRAMFYGARASVLDLSSFDTSNVTDMRSMFAETGASELDLSSFDTSNVTDMAYMFFDTRARTGYARTQEDAGRFNNSSHKTKYLLFVVK